MTVIAGQKDYTFNRISRRSHPEDIIPSVLIGRKLKAKVVIDTSGSMGTEDLNVAIAEVAGLLKNSHFRDGIEVACCDSAMSQTQRVFRASKVELSGGGGTDMSVAIKQFSEERPRPDLIIVITDGITPWPQASICGVPVTAVVTRPADSYYLCPSWIKQIRVRPVTR